MLVHHHMATADRVQGPNELAIIQVALVFQVWRPLGLDELLVKGLVISMSVLIRCLEVLRVNLVKNLLVPEHDVALLAWAGQDVQVALQKRLSEVDLLDGLRWLFRIGHPVVHQQLLRQQQVLLQPIAMDFTACMREEHLTHSFSVLHYISHELVISVRVFRGVYVVYQLFANHAHFSRDLQDNCSIVDLLNAL